jgi:hypothetical protein
MHRVLHDEQLRGHCYLELARAKRIVLAYRDFLRHKTALHDWKSTHISPPFPEYESQVGFIDAVWHIHLSNPNHYAEDMATLTGGRIIEHHPVPLDAAIEEGRIQLCYDMQVQLMKQQACKLDKLCWLPPGNSNKKGLGVGCC